MSNLSAVVVAAGRSRRFNQSRNSDSSVSKQLLEWNDQPLFIHTLKALSVLSISELALVILNDEEFAVCEQVRKHLPGLSVRIAFGGERRQDSVRNGLMALRECGRVFIHDAARPFVTSGLLKRLNEASLKSTAVIPAMPVVETLKEIDASGRVIKTHDRNRFVRIQTPQFFNYKILRSVHEKLANASIEFTDDAMMMEHEGHAVQTVVGDAENIKVTTVSDLLLRGIHV